MRALALDSGFERLESRLARTNAKLDALIFHLMGPHRLPRQEARERGPPDRAPF